MRKILILFITLIVIVAVYSCKPSLYVPTVDSASTNASLETLTAGRNLYMANCGKCHRLHQPSSYDANRWKGLVNKMQARAHITNEEKDKIYQYLISAPKKKA